MSLVQKPAPDFKATAVFANGDEKEISLSSLQGKYVVLFFYPFDFTFVCPTEILAFSNHIEEFKKRNVEVLGVSIDSAHVHRAWRATKVEDGGIGPIGYPLVADVNKDIARAYGVLLDGGMALRGTFLIDKAGTVRQETVNDLPLGRSVEETLRLVDALQYVEEHGEVCPAGWQKGKTAMKANPAGVAAYLKENATSL
ncbi:MAG: peroxiredoxin [Myxococcales bacterium]|jgi:peroxiredoxin (alkyl hydroperoxide reductase subunit C)|nr:peroxiredoxin [Myxococcales bacterium]MBL0196079.1 peroxiredoxin [Myxococcales bacterium]HQY64178.1 peroxiredoxin [Polyangiaceae bacterium]